jgi:hypothetical protein
MSAKFEKDVERERLATENAELPRRIEELMRLVRLQVLLSGSPRSPERG